MAGKWPKNIPRLKLRIIDEQKTHWEANEDKIAKN